MKHRALILAAVSLAFLALPGGAFAQKPDRDVAPFEDEFTTSRCGFPVNVVVEGMAIHTEFSNGHVKEVYPPRQGDPDEPEYWRVPGRGHPWPLVH